MISEEDLKAMEKSVEYNDDRWIPALVAEVRRLNSENAMIVTERNQHICTIHQLQDSVDEIRAELEAVEEDMD